MTNFIEQIIEEDLRIGKHDGRVATRCPPEPTDTSTSDTPKVFASTTVWERVSEALAGV